MEQKKENPNNSPKNTRVEPVEISVRLANIQSARDVSAVKTILCRGKNPQKLEEAKEFLETALQSDALDPDRKAHYLKLNRYVGILISAPNKKPGESLFEKVTGLPPE